MSSPLEGEPPSSPVVRHLTGERVLLVRWVPGSDTLLGVCHCGAEHLAQSPIEVWEWLLGHPVGHEAAAGMPVPADAKVIPAPA